MNMKTIKVGVIYQDEAALQIFQDRLIAHFALDLFMEEDLWTITGEYPNYLEGGNISFKEKYTFHQIRTFTDTLNIAGMEFSVYSFVDGMYDAETLNYLNTRIRG